MKDNTELWDIEAEDFEDLKDQKEKLRFLIKYAVLAPSSHNTQPWLFSIKDDKIELHIDLDRWLKVADKDKREIYISAGCALENLVTAADYFGYDYKINYFPEEGNEELVAGVELHENGKKGDSEHLINYITTRHTNHNEYDSKPIPKDDLDILSDLSDYDDIYVHLTDDPDIKRKVDDMMMKGDAILFSDPEWREELGEWIGKGVFGESWLMSKIGQLAVTYLNMGKSTGKKNSELIMSSPILGVISSKNDNRISQVKTGRLYEKLSLTTTSMNIQSHPMSQLMEIEELRDEVSNLIPVDDVIPQHTFRLGYAEPEERTPRRDLEEMLM